MVGGSKKSFTPTIRREGAEQVLAMQKGGGGKGRRFWGSFNTGA